MTAAFSGVPVHVRRLGGVLLLVVCMSALVSGTTIAEQTETVRLGQTTEVSVRINYTELTSQQVSLLVPEHHQPQEVTGHDRNGELSCEYMELENEILCTPSPHNGSYEVVVEYETSRPSQVVDGYRSYSTVRRIFVPFEQYSLRVVLPEGFGLIGGDNVTAYEPIDGEPGTDDNGRRFYVEWVADEVPIGDPMRFTVRYQELNVFQDIFPTSPAVIVAFLLILVAAGLSVYMRRTQSSSDTIASVFPMLKDDEKDVIRYMVDNGGECGQKDLVDDLDYSKAKISRLVKDLEERNLIKKIKEGRRNRLKLKKDLGDVEFA